MALFIFSFWVILNGRVTLEIALLGVGVTALAMLFLCKGCQWSVRREMMLYRAIPYLIVYALIVIWEIMKANVRTGKVVWGGKPSPVVRKVNTKLKTRFAKMALANCITLTPGTITISVEGNELTVHCLTEDMAQGLDNTVFERRLLQLEEKLHG